jgi:hypothetical protein
LARSPREGNPEAAEAEYPRVGNGRGRARQEVVVRDADEQAGLCGGRCGPGEDREGSEPRED